ncbi:MAG: DNA replication/repair protein RecF [Proteobacteria bacterium]|nr:DNA replication/repair protein RecF [Pseudomonadota bacterium]
MFIDSLQVRSFRNIAEAELDFCRGFNIFHGANAQGKSNLLEAIFTLAFLKGFRSARLGELVSFGASQAQIGANVEREESLMRLDVWLEQGTRRAFIDKAPCERVRDYLGALRVILFVPSDVGLLQGSPSSRRTLLDRMVFNLRPVYLMDLDVYQRLIRLKSALLRQPSPDQALLDVYDGQLVEAGSRVLASRYRYLRALSPYVRAVFSTIFGSGHHCELIYQPDTYPQAIVLDGRHTDIEASLCSTFQSRLRASRARELARGSACVGPHRDDWSLQLDGRSAREYASQGQQRALILALKMAEISCLQEECGIEPIFLLDDVSSELDPDRNSRLIAHLASLSAQTFLTTTSRTHFPAIQQGKVFHVSGGSIQHES